MNLSMVTLCINLKQTT